MPYRLACDSPILWRRFLSWGSFLSDESNLCQVDIKTSWHRQFISWASHLLGDSSKTLGGYPKPSVLLFFLLEIFLFFFSSKGGTQKLPCNIIASITPFLLQGHYESKVRVPEHCQDYCYMINEWVAYSVILWTKSRSGKMLGFIVRAVQILKFMYYSFENSYLFDSMYRFLVFYVFKW